MPPFEPPISAKETSELPQSDGADFLAGQAEMAKAALQKVLRDAQVALGEGVDPKEWARRYPLVAVGAAVAVGFAGVCLAVPSKQEQELRKLERIRRALTPEAHPSTNGATGDGAAKPPAVPSMWAGLFKELIGILRPIITGLISAGVAAHQNGQATAPSSDVPPAH